MLVASKQRARALDSGSVTDVVERAAFRKIAPAAGAASAAIALPNKRHDTLPCPYGSVLVQLLKFTAWPFAMLVLSMFRSAPAVPTVPCSMATVPAEL